MGYGQDAVAEARRVLGLPPGADLEQVTHAYRALARTWHPGGGRGGPVAGQQATRLAGCG
ncbi:curved DNA-binding protein CbpA [Streptacidiphilus sp. EB103A]